MSTIKHPFGAVDTKTLTASGVQAVAITDQLTVIDGITTLQTAATTLNLTIGSEVTVGALLHIRRKTNHGTAGNRAFTFGDGITADAYTPADDKAWFATFIYNGTAFVPAGAIYVEA